MDLEGIMLNEMSEERQILYDFTYMWNQKAKQTNKIKQRQTHRYRGQIRVTGEEGAWGAVGKMDEGVNCMVMDGNYTWWGSLHSAYIRQIML